MKLIEMKIYNTIDNPVFYGASPLIFKRASELRKRMTETEKTLWSALRRKKRKGYKFRRQHPMSIYIADFYCHQLKLVIEIDGGYHLKKEIKEKDEKRTKNLLNLGVVVLCFTNNQITHSLSQVLNEIKTIAEIRINEVTKEQRISPSKGD